MTITDWIQAIATVVAAVSLVFAWKSVKASQAQAQIADSSFQKYIKDVESERKARELAEAQSVDVFWGYDRERMGEVTSHVLMVSNRGSASLYDFRAEASGDLDHLALTAEVVPPGAWRARLRARDEREHFRLAHLVPAEPSRFAIADTAGYSIRNFIFFDARGVQWQSVNGRLAATGQTRSEVQK